MQLNGCVNNMIINAQTKLNIEQDFKVQAGPGAGKTEFLVNHITNVIQTSEKLERMKKIACITYTNTVKPDSFAKVRKKCFKQSRCIYNTQLFV